jgi:hypothetical protein
MYVCIFFRKELPVAVNHGESNPNANTEVPHTSDIVGIAGKHAMQAESFDFGFPSSAEC